MSATSQQWKHYPKNIKLFKTHAFPGFFPQCKLAGECRSPPPSFTTELFRLGNIIIIIIIVGVKIRSTACNLKLKKSTKSLRCLQQRGIHGIYRVILTGITLLIMQTPQSQIYILKESIGITGDKPVLKNSFTSVPLLQSTFITCL